MAASFDALGSFRSVMVTSGTQVEDVQVVTCSTKPTGIRFTYAVPLLTWQTETDAAGTLGPIADALEALVSDHHVIGGSDSQDFNANNFLTDFVDLTIAYDRSASGLPTLYGQVSVPVVNFLAVPGFTVPGYFDPGQACDDEYARLAALAAA